MDIFERVARDEAFFRAAAVAAGHELGLFSYLASPRALDVLAAGLCVAPRRLGALVDYLAAVGVLSRTAGPRYARAEVPSGATLPPAGWGRLAAAIRRDRAIDEELAGEESAARFQRHLASEGRDAARELAGRLGHELCEGELLDAGGGAGAYTAAFLEHAPASTATLIDRPDVLPLAAELLGALAARVRLVAADLRDGELGAGHRVALLANVLHLHGPADCAAMVRAASRAVVPGGLVVVKELRVDSDRSGPISGLLFALNMALYTDNGDAHDADRIAGWMWAAGLTDLRVFGLASAPDAVVVTGRRAGP